MYQTSFRMLAAYNEWANTRIYDAVAALTDEQRQEDRGLFFGSLMGTLNHLLTADRIWLKRMTGEGEAPDGVDAILYPAFEPLRVARRAEDARIALFVEELDEAEFSEPFSYRNTRGTEFTQSLAPVLFHLFNHQTHHRGQCHAALTGLGRPSVVLDMVTFQRETAP